MTDPAPAGDESTDLVNGFFGAWIIGVVFIVVAVVTWPVRKLIQLARRAVRHL